MRPTIEVLASAFLGPGQKAFKVQVPVDKILGLDHACAPDGAVLDLEDSEWTMLWVKDTVAEVYAKINIAMVLTK